MKLFQVECIFLIPFLYIRLMECTPSDALVLIICIWNSDPHLARENTCFHRNTREYNHWNCNYWSYIVVCKLQLMPQNNKEKKQRCPHYPPDNDRWNWSVLYCSYFFTAVRYANAIIIMNYNNNIRNNLQSSSFFFKMFNQFKCGIMFAIIRCPSLK